VLVLFLVPIYTNYLTTEQLGQTDLIVQIANWLIPIFSLTVYEAMIRFGLDKAVDNVKVFTIGNLVVFSGLAALCVIMPIVKLTGVLAAGRKVFPARTCPAATVLFCRDMV
jgi:O-antigen/teichoic acid export membrane protein